MVCSVVKKLQIVPGCLDDYNKLAGYHYRSSRLGPYAAIFKLVVSRAEPLEIENRKLVVSEKKACPERSRRVEPSKVPIGVIVYTMPSPGLELRNIATNNLFAGFDRSTRLSLVNKNVRCISRVIIEPRFRGLGLASRLVRETMPKMNVAIVEAMAVMGLVNPFFEKAGMTAFRGKMPARCVRLIEAFSMVGIEKKQLIDTKKVQHALEQAPYRSGTGQAQPSEAEFIELEIKRFLQSYGKRRYMPPGPERTRFVLSKLTERPVYYIWFNPKDSGQRIEKEKRKSICQIRCNLSCWISWLVIRISATE